MNEGTAFAAMVGLLGAGYFGFMAYGVHEKTELTLNDFNKAATIIQTIKAPGEKKTIDLDGNTYTVTLAPSAP